jgi:Flp pilus assembly CpaF family ATPase
LPRWSTGGPLPRLHVVRRALTNRTTTAGSGRCAESEAAAIVTKVTAGQYVKLQVWTTRCPSLTQADGTRVHAVLGTVASASTCISLRVPARGGLSLEDCVASGSLTPGAAQLLSRVVEAKLAFLISGGTGSGKDDSAVKTLLGWRIAAVPDGRSASLSAADEYVSWARL